MRFYAEKQSPGEALFWYSDQYSHRTTTFCGVVWAGMLKVEVV